QANNRSEKQEKQDHKSGHGLPLAVGRRPHGRLMDGRGMECRNAKRPARRSGRQKGRLELMPSPIWRGSATTLPVIPEIRTAMLPGHEGGFLPPCQSLYWSAAV